MTSASAPRAPQLPGQTVIVIGGSAGIGLETAWLARAEGASVIITGRTADRLRSAASDVGAQRYAAFDATDWTALDRLFDGLTEPVDQVMVTAGGPYYALLADIDFGQVQRTIDEHITCRFESHSMRSARFARAEP